MGLLLVKEKCAVGKRKAPLSGERQFRLGIVIIIFMKHRSVGLWVGKTVDSRAVSSGPRMEIQGIFCILALECVVLEIND